MRAECITQYKQLEGILDKGDIVEIEVIKSTEDQIIVHKTVLPKPNRFQIDEDTISPAGSYVDYKFKSKNGHYYTGTIIKNHIGNKTLFDLFKKI